MFSNFSKKKFYNLITLFSSWFKQHNTTFICTVKIQLDNLDTDENFKLGIHI